MSTKVSQYFTKLALFQNNCWDLQVCRNFWGWKFGLSRSSYCKSNCNENGKMRLKHLWKGGQGFAMYMFLHPNFCKLKGTDTLDSLTREKSNNLVNNLGNCVKLVFYGEQEIWPCGPWWTLRNTLTDQLLYLNLHKHDLTSTLCKGIHPAQCTRLTRSRWNCQTRRCW